MKLAFLLVSASLWAQTPDQSNPLKDGEEVVTSMCSERCHEAEVKPPVKVQHAAPAIPPEMYIELGQLIAAQQNWNQRAQQICQGLLTRDYKCAPKPEKEPAKQ